MEPTCFLVASSLPKQLVPIQYSSTLRAVEIRIMLIWACHWTTISASSLAFFTIFKFLFLFPLWKFFTKDINTARCHPFLSNHWDQHKYFLASAPISESSDYVSAIAMFIGFKIDNNPITLWKEKLSNGWTWETKSLFLEEWTCPWCILQLPTPECIQYTQWNTAYPVSTIKWTDLAYLTLLLPIKDWPVMWLSSFHWFQCVCCCNSKHYYWLLSVDGVNYLTTK